MSDSYTDVTTRTAQLLREVVLLMDQVADRVDAIEQRLNALTTGAIAEGPPAAPPPHKLTDRQP